MRQMRSSRLGRLTANVVPESIFHRGTPNVCGIFDAANGSWHTYCLGVSRNPLAPTQRSWTPSLPNSRNTGSPARVRRRTSAPVAAARICCRLRSRKPWRNSPSASARRAAFTDNPLHIGRRADPAQRLHRRRGKRRTTRSPLPATFLPAGFFLRSFTQADGARPTGRPVERAVGGAGFQTATLALIGGWHT